jgi:hypothetical protein
MKKAGRGAFRDDAARLQDSKSCNETGVARGSPEKSCFIPGFKNFAKTV